MTEVMLRYGLVPNRMGFISCPFHYGDNSPSLKVYKESFHCFACGANGDVFSFVQQMENVDFKEAYKILGGNYGNSMQVKKARYQYRKHRETLARKKARRETELWNWMEKVRKYKKIMEECPPLSDRWAEACHGKFYAEYRIESIRSEI